MLRGVILMLKSFALCSLAAVLLLALLQERKQQVFAHVGEDNAAAWLHETGAPDAPGHGLRLRRLSPARISAHGMDLGHWPRSALPYLASLASLTDVTTSAFILQMGVLMVVILAAASLVCCGLRGRRDARWVWCAVLGALAVTALALHAAFSLDAFSICVVMILLAAVSVAVGLCSGSRCLGGVSSVLGGVSGVLAGVFPRVRADGRGRAAVRRAAMQRRA